MDYRPKCADPLLLTLERQRVSSGEQSGIVGMVRSRERSDRPETWTRAIIPEKQEWIFIPGNNVLDDSAPFANPFANTPWEDNETTISKNRAYRIGNSQATFREIQTADR